MENKLYRIRCSVSAHYAGNKEPCILYSNIRLTSKKKCAEELFKEEYSIISNFYKIAELKECISTTQWIKFDVLIPDKIGEFSVIEKTIFKQCFKKAIT